jgi:hypothetical protein
MLSILSKRLLYGAGTGSARGTLLAGLRYEYDGLNVLPVDELYDNDTGGLETNDACRAREANTHLPGSLGALLAKRVYDYSSATSAGVLRNLGKKLRYDNHETRQGTPC